MKTYQFSTIGIFHTNHNEDSLVVEKIEENKTLIAVMDGCTMGKESHFASALMGKILRRLSRNHFYLSFITRKENSLEDLLKNIMKGLFENLVMFQNNLGLETDELLSTIILGVIDEKQKTAELITIGDGLIFCDSKIIEYEQDNMPDYLGYHLQEDFENWYNKQEQKLSLENIENLSISTDGIFTFQGIDDNKTEVNQHKIFHHLFENAQEADSSLMLKKKVYEMEKEWNLKPTDDLTLIRVIWQ